MCSKPLSWQRGDRPREEDDLLQVSWPITRAAGARSWAGERAKGRRRDRWAGRQTHTKEPYFGGHPFHFTRYSTLPWEEREKGRHSEIHSLPDNHSQDSQAQRTSVPYPLCRQVSPSTQSEGPSADPCQPRDHDIWLPHDDPGPPSVQEHRSTSAPNSSWGRISELQHPVSSCYTWGN